jgi:hypothetical protein
MWYEKENNKKVIVSETENGWTVQTMHCHHDIWKVDKFEHFKTEKDCIKFVCQFFDKKTDGQK